MTDVCLHLLADPSLEEKLLDRLLLHPAVPSFVSQRAASHGGHSSELDQSEQVLGRGDAVLIQALLSAEDADELLDALRADYAHTGVMFWIVPVVARGVL